MRFLLRLAHLRDPRTRLCGRCDGAFLLTIVNVDALIGNGAGIYDLTDDVTDEQFDAAVEDGKDRPESDPSARRADRRPPRGGKAEGGFTRSRHLHVPCHR